MLSKFCVSRNFDNAVSQPPYVGVEGKGGRPGPYRSGATSALTQIVPDSASV